MRSKLLFCNAYYYWLDPKQMDAGQPYPPLGTLFAASYMRECGYDVSLHDNNLHDNRVDLYARLESGAFKYLIIYDDGFNYLTKMCLTKMREACFQIIHRAKSLGVTVIVNSSDSTDQYLMYHDEGADVVIHGEGEFTLKEVLEVLQSNSPLAQVQGVSYAEKGEIHKNSGRPVLKDLDELPDPAWDLINIEPYRKIWMKSHGYISLNLATTRGCPYKCNWCAKPIYGNRYNSRSPERVVNEIEYLIDKFDVNYFWMCDDIFGLKPNWVENFSKLVVERNLKFKYKIQSRVDLMLKESQIDNLVASGVDTIWIGAESGSQKILDDMDKGTKVEQIYEATRILKSKGIKVAFFLQFGYLGEKWSDIKKTIKMVLKLMPDDIGISVSYPLPGTKFYERVKLDLIGKANWEDSDDLDMMFSNTYRPSFYKTLQRYVHNRYRIKKAWLSFRKLINNPLNKFAETMIHIARGIYHTPLALANKILLSIRSSN